MVSYRGRMNSLQTQFVCTSLLLLLFTSKLAFAGAYCRNVDCRSDFGRALCRVCARPPPGKRSESEPQPPPNVRDLFAARIEDADDQFDKYSDPVLSSNSCILETLIRRLSPRSRNEIIQILEKALGFSVEEYTKYTNE